MKRMKNLGLRLTLIILVVTFGPVKSYSQPGHSALYLPVILRNYPCYSLEIGSVGISTEYRFTCLQHHFMTLIEENGTLNLRPHPGRDVNGWGSSWYLQPFLAGAILKNTIIDSVAAHPDRIHINASGQILRGTASTYGTWNVTLDFTYDSAAKQVSGTGSYNVSLAGELSSETGDLNLYKIASNYLDDVPVLSGGINDTGDMASVTVTRDDFLSFVWTPPIDDCPQLPAQKLAVDVSGVYNNVNTAAQGYAPIQPAYKPSLKVVLASTLPAGTAMTFCGFYDETNSHYFAADNVGVHAIIRQGTTQRDFHYQVEFQSQALPGECGLPSSCEALASQ